MSALSHPDTICDACGEDHIWETEDIGDCCVCWGSGSVLETGCRCLSCHETCGTCAGTGKRLL